MRNGFLDLLDQFTDRRRRHRAVLIARLGLDGEPPRALGSIATEYEVSRERIRQLESAALASVARAARRAQRDSGAVAAVECLESIVTSGTDDAMQAVFAADAAFPAAYPRTAVRALLAMVLLPGNQRRRLVRAAITAAIEREHRLVTAYRSQGAADRASRKVQQLLADAEWPKALVPAQPFIASPLQRTPAREGSMDVTASSAKAGTMPSTKLGRDVRYDSILELSLLTRLDAAPAVTRFAEQPFAIAYTDDDGRRRLYYPDVLIDVDDGRIVLVEVKPLAYVPHAGNHQKFAAGRALAHARGWGFLVTDGHRTLRQLMRHIPAANRAAQGVEALASLVHRSTGCGWAEVRLVRDRYGLSTLDLSAAIVQHGWHLSLAPYRLTTATT